MANEKETKTRGKANLGAVIILVISAIVFIPAGGAAVFQSIRNRASSFGSVNGEKITYEPGSKFYQAASNIASQYKRYGIELKDSIYQQIIRSAYNQTVAGIYYNDAVKNSGYEVPAEAINRSVIANFSVNGVFDKKLYDQQTPSFIAGLKNDIRDDLIYRRFIDDNFGTDTNFNKKAVYGLKSSDAEKSFLKDLGAKKYSFTVASFNQDKYPNEEVAAFAKQNASKFEKYDLLAITVDEKKQADEILSKLRSQELTFEDALVDSKKLFSDESGKFTSPYRFQLEKLLAEGENADSISSLKKDEYSEPVATLFGFTTKYTIFKGNGESVSPDFDSDELLRTVSSYIKSNESSVIETYLINQAKDFIDEYAVKDFDSACKKFDITKEEVEPFGLNYGNTSFSDSPSGILASASYEKDILTKLFALKENEVSEPVVFGKNVIVVLCTKIENVQKPESTEEENPSDDVASKILSADQNAVGSYLTASGAFVDNYEQAYTKVFSTN